MMRLHPLYVFFSIPAVFIACSSGGPGSAPGPGSTSAFGQPGATNSPLPVAAGGGESQGPGPNPGTDTGTPGQDTGGGTDTRPATDTGGGGEGVCARTSKCSDELLPASFCNAEVADATCGSFARTYITCLYDNQTCKTDGTNATDQEATGAACQSQGMAYQSCKGT